MNFIQWLAIPITAYASLNPVPVTPSKTPLLGEESAYVVDYPVDSQNALYATVEAQGTYLSTSTLLAMYLPSQMMPVINCESHFRQWDSNGHILTSSTDDVGIAQINVKTWGAKALELGYDIYTTEGNLKMARYIYDTAGIQSWVCWGIINGIKS